MTQLAFTVFDSAAKAYLDPFFAPTIESALRSFREVVNRPDHQFNKFPEDYTLFHVGQFCQETGMFTAIAPHSLGVALTFINGPRLIGEANNG